MHPDNARDRVRVRDTDNAKASARASSGSGAFEQRLSHHLELLRDVLIPDNFPVPLPPDHPVYDSHKGFRADPVPGKIRGTWMAVRPAPVATDPDQWQWVCLRCLSEVEWAPYNRVGKPSRCRGLDWLADRLDTLDPVESVETLGQTGRN